MEEPAAVLSGGSPTRAGPLPFRFSTSLILPEATGLRAATLPQLAQLLREVSEGCIYHHTHYFLLAHHYLTPEPTNDLAYWVGEVLGERALGERLTGIDTIQYASLTELRAELVKVVEDYLARRPMAGMKFANEGEEFFFIKSVHVVMPTALMASTLAEFAATLERVSLASLYFHLFDARLRLGRPTNDFARWLDEQWHEAALAAEVAAVDPYANSLDTVRSQVVALVRQRLNHA